MDLSRLLRCIAEVETGDDATKVGLSGERGRYGMKEATWLQHAPHWKFERCVFPYDGWVAWKHIEWLDDNIPHQSPLEKDFRSYALAWAWHGGLVSWNKGKDALINNAYAVRVTNLYDDATFAAT